ncbi:PLD nuclease N-terminal domain-containing protein [Microbacterium sp. SD291]|uniref:PLD nuclease N-terminal domain-containing protein n=1 Tax=Microbacterium sp. SD291 TaxID=2782007 RepID=UPI001A96E321|nr:PLD nuclease N-terminal domain-containing protein [Microbacterium sp. SD291]MBO0981305.1 PLDc_N domain-containing protein [Microbacterium sp. SD291]
MPFLSIIIVLLMVVALVDIITRDDSQVRFMPKLVWLIVVILLPLIGSILWFAIGREYSEAGLRIPRMQRAERAPRPSARPSPPPMPPADARSTEQQLADLDREIEEWRLREEIEKRRRDSSTGSETQPDAGPEPR